MSYMGERGEVIFRDGVLTWTIENFSCLSGSANCCYDTPCFHFRGRRWYLQLYPNGKSNLDSESQVRLYLILTRESIYGNPPIRLRYSLGIQTADGRDQVWADDKKTFQRSKQKVCALGSRRSELLRRREELLPQDVLTVIATLEDDGDEEDTREVSVQTEVEHKVADASIQTDVGEKEVREKTGGEKLLLDIEKLWASGESSDVVLKVKDVEFKAHKAFLTARIPALCAMFQHDTKEKASGVATIDDCDPAVFEQLMHYIYTGAIRVLNAENAAALYVVADKYLVSEIKALCVRCMKNELCLDTFCDYVTLSLMFNESELLELAIDYLSGNMTPVIKTVEWQRFLKEHPIWANEILIRAMSLIEAKLRLMPNLG